MRFEIKDVGKFKIVSIDGDVENDAEAKKLTEKISRLAGGGHANFCFNLENVTYLNSSGVSVFIHALSEVESKEGSVYMIVRDPQVRNVVELA